MTCKRKTLTVLTWLIKYVFFATQLLGLTRFYLPTHLQIVAADRSIWWCIPTISGSIMATRATYLGIKAIGRSDLQIEEEELEPSNLFL
ncbi:hypothetical protein GQ457_16G012670 [Hibiscus cannabinus]